jgi:hypothetical protein
MKSLCKVILALGLMPALFAQTSTKAPSDQSAKKDAAEKEQAQENYYKLNFAIFELEDGKRMNQREYSMIAKSNDGRPTSVRVATRVPISSPEKQIQYIDAGLDIRCSSVKELASKIAVACDVSISNFVLPEQSAEARNSVGPVLRTTRADYAWAVVALGKPSIFSTIDDVNSKKRIQIELTATKID